MLEEMRILYSREFANIPVENRPKPPSWAARAAIYKNQNDREKYFQELIQGSRNSLKMKTSSNYKMSEGNTTTLVDNIITSLKRLTEDAKTLKRSMTRRGNNIFSERINNSNISINKSNISENNRASQYELTTPIQSLPRTKKRKRPHSRLTTPPLNF